MAKTGINKLEQPGPRRRRVDTDDLMALAVALDVSPLRLLLPAGPLSQMEQLTETRRARVKDMWRWGRGERPLPERGRLDLDRGRRFKRENQPDNPPDDIPMTDLARHAPALRAVLAAVEAVEREGIPRSTVLAYLQLVGTLPTTDEKGDPHGKC
jgi:hypothetical protein